MSNPQNILGKFDTYAYHHILMVCDSTQTAEALAESTEITTFQHPRNGVRYSARPLKDGKYVTLIDGTTDARFFITDARWSTIIAAGDTIGKGDLPQSTSMTTDGELDIVEPMGASFLNRLTDICDELETDPVGLIFLIKTIFVGHNANGKTEMISSVRPLMFVAYDISAIFDSSGAKYKMSFVGLTNGAGKLPQPNKIFEGLSFVIKPTLTKTFESIEASINEKYKGYKERAATEFAKTLEDVALDQRGSTATRFLIDNYRDVKYKIISTDYDSYPAGDIEHIRIKDKLDAPTVNYGGDVGIEDILKRIMASSSRVVADKNDPEEKYIYKIISTLRSTPTEYIIEYHINKYKQAISPYTQQQKDGNVVPLDGQSIEFDYIFTGKNVDIKTFDIKMEMGMAFFQIAATTNNIPAQEEAISGATSHMVHTTGSTDVASTGMKLRGRTPLFLGSTLKNQMSRNTTKPVDSASFQALLERHAALENVAANMTIYGNPQLLDEMSILPSEVGAKQTEDAQKNATINPQWLSVPTLIKVNIKMPVDANDVNTEYEQFWYSGYYMLLSVDSVFADGVFTQELEMFSIPIGNEIDSLTDEEKEEIAFDKEFDEAIAQEAANIAANSVPQTETELKDRAAINKQKILTRRGFRYLKRAPVKHEIKIED